MMVIFLFMVLILPNVLFKFFCHGFPKTSAIDLLLELLVHSDDDALGTSALSKLPNGARYRRLGRTNSRNGKLPKLRTSTKKRAESQPSGARCVGQSYITYNAR
jgi:hypothetical protein